MKEKELMEKLMLTEADLFGLKLAVQESLDNLLFGPPKIRKARIFTRLEPMEDLLKRDEQRVKDGFPKKIRTRSTIVGNKVISVPFVEEEKLIHGEFEPKKLKKWTKFPSPAGARLAFLAADEEDEDIGETGGRGPGEVGDVIGEIPISGAGGGGGSEPGTEPGPHEEEIYETGKRLMEKYELPNLREKGKKVMVEEPIYELTDRYRGAGQVLDKKATMRRIIKTNIQLGRIKRGERINPRKLVVGPSDKIYRIVSRERQYKSMAVVFFLRDYSGSMWGEPTEVIVEQHLMIYAWLMVQYERLVIPRFIVHDTEAREVTVEQYFRLMAGGGTLIPSGYRKILEIIKSEGLDRDYNIYIFQGTDGEDFDDGTQAIPLIREILKYTNRMGVTVLQHPYWGEDRETWFEQYVKRGNFVSQKSLFRMYTMSYLDVTEEQQAEAIKYLVAQD